jgi:1-acyl-sn-glycerol-3-phosphate acyltransferase
MVMGFLRGFARLIIRLFTHTQAVGVEYIPDTGAVLVTTNHLGIADIPLIAAFINRNDATLLAAKKHRSIAPIRWIVDSIDGIWVDREDVDLRALRAARDFLKDGHMLGVAPEGTRSQTNALIEGQPGAAYLASVGNAPILPVAVTGPEFAAEKLKSFRRPYLNIRFGKLYTLPPLDRKDREASLKRNTDEVMCRIAALLPPEYRGVYSDHPRLKALLEEEEYSPA